MLEVAVVGLRAPAVGHIAGGHDELCPGGAGRLPDERVDRRLVRIEIVGEGGAGRVQRLPEVTDDVERQRRGGAGGVQRGERLGRVGPQQVDRAGTERSVAVRGAR